MVFLCDTCGRSYTYKRNLRRHVKERHLRKHKFMCPRYDCRVEFIRRTYISMHLTKCHKYTQLEAREIVKGLQPISLHEKRNVEYLQCVSKNEYSDSDSFDEWLDAQLEYKSNDDSVSKAVDDGWM